MFRILHSIDTTKSRIEVETHYSVVRIRRTLRGMSLYSQLIRLVRRCMLTALRQSRSLFPDSGGERFVAFAIPIGWF